MKSLSLGECWYHGGEGLAWWGWTCWLGGVSRTSAWRDTLSERRQGQVSWDSQRWSQLGSHWLSGWNEGRLWLEIVGIEAGLEQVRGRDPDSRMEWPQSTKELCSWDFSIYLVASWPRTGPAGSCSVPTGHQKELACWGTGPQSRVHFFIFIYIYLFI